MVNLQVERIDRQDKKWMSKVYLLRKRVFVDECRFPSEDRMVYNEFDALSNHYLLVMNGSLVGSVSVVDLTGEKDILERKGLNSSLITAKVTKLAVLSQARGLSTLNRLLAPLKEEVVKYDFIFGELAPPSNNLNDLSRYNLVRPYEIIGGLNLLPKLI